MLKGWVEKGGGELQYRFPDRNSSNGILCDSTGLIPCSRFISKLYNGVGSEVGVLRVDEVSFIRASLASKLGHRNKGGLLEG